MEMSQIKKAIKEHILIEVLKRPDFPLKDNTPLITGGLIDSFAIVNTIVFAESTFGVNLPEGDFVPENIDTIEQIAALILHHLSLEDS